MNKEELIKAYFEGGNAKGLKWGDLEECLKVIGNYCDKISSEESSPHGAILE